MLNQLLDLSDNVSLRTLWYGRHLKQFEVVRQKDICHIINDNRNISFTKIIKTTNWSLIHISHIHLLYIINDDYADQIYISHIQ